MSALKVFIFIFSFFTNIIFFFLNIDPFLPLPFPLPSSFLEIQQTKRFLKPLHTSIKTSEKKAKLSPDEKALKDEITRVFFFFFPLSFPLFFPPLNHFFPPPLQKAHQSRHKVKEHLKFMNEFVCFSPQAADSFEGMDDALFVQQITQVWRGCWFCWFFFGVVCCWFLIIIKKKKKIGRISPPQAAKR